MERPMAASIPLDAAGDPIHLPKLTRGHLSKPHTHIPKSPNN